MGDGGAVLVFQNWFFSGRAPGRQGETCEQITVLILGNMGPDRLKWKKGTKLYFYRFCPRWNDHAGHGKSKDQRGKIWIAYPAVRGRGVGRTEVGLAPG